MAEKKDIRAFIMADGFTYIGEFDNPLYRLENYVVTRTLTTGESEKPLETEYREEYYKYAHDRKKLMSKRISLYRSAIIGEIRIEEMIEKK